MKNRRSKGFSLIELLIVVTIILIIAAIAIPKLLTVKQLANSTAAVANMRSINNALTAYSTQYPAVGYPAGLASLSGSGTTPSSTSALLVDTLLTGATSAASPKQGYYFTYSPSGGTPSTTYTLLGTPTTNAGTRNFFTDQSAEIHYNDTGSSSASDPLIG